jgi:hypothetical protein
MDQQKGALKRGNEPFNVTPTKKPKMSDDSHEVDANMIESPGSALLRGNKNVDDDPAENSMVDYVDDYDQIKSPGRASGASSSQKSDPEVRNIKDNTVEAEDDGPSQLKPKLMTDYEYEGYQDSPTSPPPSPEVSYSLRSAKYD